MGGRDPRKFLIVIAVVLAAAAVVAVVAPHLPRSPPAATNSAQAR
jgi:hypothetical protein